MEDSKKFTAYWDYCKQCVHKDKDDTDEPCNTCLEVPARFGTKKPYKFKASEEEAAYISNDTSAAYEAGESMSNGYMAGIDSGGADIYKGV